MDRKIGFLDVFTREEAAQIHLTALRVLEEVGVRLPHRRVLEVFREAGARVDFDDNMVRIPASLVCDCIARMPPRFTFYARSPERCLDMNGRDTYFSGPNAAINIIDIHGDYRRSTPEDGQSFARLVDMLPNYDIGTGGVYPPGLPSPVLEAWSYLVSIENSAKPVLAASTSGECARVILRMAEVVASACGLQEDQLPVMAVVNTTSPLHNVPGELDAFLEYLERAVPVMIAPEVQAGATGPATLAGSFAQATAEFLSHACIAQLLHPGAPLLYGTVSSVFDMRKMMLPYGAPEADLLSMATAQMARYYGIPSRGTGGSSDANSIGTQTGVESLMSNLACLLAGSSYVNHSGGELENTLASSFEKAVLDDEIIAMARRLARGIEVSPETLAFEVIKSVGPGGEFLTAEHTLKHYRSEQMMPTVMDRDKHDAWVKAGGRSAEERARDRASDLLKAWEPHPLPGEASKELRGIYESLAKSAEAAAK